MGSTVRLMPFVRPFALLLLLALLPVAVADPADDYSPEILLIRFTPGVIRFPSHIDHDHAGFTALLSDASIEDPALRSLLEEVGVLSFETIAAPWRHLTARDSLDRHGRRVPLVDFTDVYRVTLRSSYGVTGAAEILRNARGVAHVEREPLLTLDFFTPNDEHYPDAWHLNNSAQTFSAITCDTLYDINAPEAWDIWDSAGTKIAIFDDGICANPGEESPCGHEDLTGFVDRSLSRKFGDEPWWHLSGHGTQVAGLAAAGTHNDSIGIAGVTSLSPNHNDSILVAIKIKDNTFLQDPITKAVNALAYVCSTGIYPKIIVTNHAWGAGGCLCWRDSHSYPTTLRDAFRNAFLLDVNLVCSAGQGAVSCPGTGSPEDECWLFPAAYLDYSLAVAAVRCNGDTLSNWPFTGSYIDLTAPGGICMPRTNNVGGYSTCTGGEGTSLSAPLVSGAIALLLGRDPALTNEDCYRLLEVTAADMPDSPLGESQRGGHGLLKLDRALTRLGWPWELRRDSCTTYAADSIDAGWKAFRNVDLGQGLSEDWDSVWVHTYALEALSPKLCTAEQRVDTVWVRGKLTTGWKNLPKYDAQFHANHAHFVEWDEPDRARFRTYTNKVFSGPGGDFLGWFPFEPGSDPFRIHYTCLAKYNVDTMSVHVELPRPTAGVSLRKSICASESVEFMIGVEAAGYYTLVVYDSCGRRVAVPADHLLLLPGSRVVPWGRLSADSAPMASGIYYARLWRDDRSRTPYGQASRFLLLK